MKKFINTFLATLLFLLAFVLLAPLQNASAQTLEGPGKMYSPFYNLCFEVEGGGTSNGTWIRAANCMPNKASQLFYRQDTSIPNRFRLLTWHVSGKCLDIEGASQASGKHLIIYTCVPSAYEQEFNRQEDHTQGTNYLWQPTHITGYPKCLAMTYPSFTHGSPIVQEICGSNLDMFWTWIQ